MFLYGMKHLQRIDIDDMHSNVLTDSSNYSQGVKKAFGEKLLILGGDTR